MLSQNPILSDISLFRSIIIAVITAIANYFTIRFAVKWALTEAWKEIRTDIYLMRGKKVPKFRKNSH